MDINIFFGLILALVSIYYGAPDIRDSFQVYLSLDAFILVFGGTVASTMISSSVKEFKNLVRVFHHIAFGKQNLKPKEAVNTLVESSQIMQKGNKQALVSFAEGKGDGFLSHALGLVAAGLETEFIYQTLETDIVEIRRRHNFVISTVRLMGSYAPMFGMAGTVIGVIQVLRNVTDIDNIVSGMALALLTTLYGLFLASIVFIPIANKLKSKTNKELLTKEIIREGTYMIMQREIPLKVEKYLSAFLEDSERSEQGA